MAEKKLLLIDGHSIANRAFYGLPPLSNAEGLHTNAILGFANIFLNIYNKEKPDYVIVAFDVKEKTFRHAMYEAYKGTRKSMPDELHEQIPVLKDVLHAMNIITVELPGYEADDIIGTYAALAEKDGLDVIILSGDRDLLQLATEHTTVVIPKTKAGGTETEVYKAEDVKAKYLVTPKEFIDVKALQGDASDNIPGIPGIGEKTASNIIVKFGSLENALEHIDEITPNKARENLKNFAEQGKMSKVLATIITDAPVPADYHKAFVESESVFYNKASYEIMKRLELKKLLARFDGISFDNASVKAESEIAYDVASLADFDKIASALSGHIGFYTDSDMAVTGLCDSDNDKIYIFPDDNGISRQTIADSILKLFKSDRQFYVFGLKNILHALDAKDFWAENIYDLEIMAYLLNPLNTGYSYDQISKVYSSVVMPSKEELLGKKAILECMESEEGKRACFKLAAMCSKTAACNFEILKNELEKQEMWELFSDMEMPLIYSLYYMEKAGICVNAGILKEISAQLSEMISEYESEIYKEAGVTFNINSPKQLGEVLFEKMQLPHGKKTKTGYSTAADVLEKLALDYPFVNKILKYRQAAKLKSTYADGLSGFILEDGRIHGSFNQTITATGRISSTDPNLQNIPTRTELGQEIRKAFVASEGCVFLDADYSQIELRLLAHMADDKNLIEAYNSAADIHKITASKVFNTPLDEVTKAQRRNAKAVNFGIVYGISSFGLSQDLSITRKEAEKYIKQYFATYPQIKEFLDNTVRLAKINGYTTTMFNRRRPIPELQSSNFMQRSFGERAAMNAPIQGSAADIIKIAMINVDRKLRQAGLKSKIVLQVHDELLVEAPVNEAEKAKEIIKQEMSRAAFLKVALEVDCNEGRDWFEAH